MVLSIFSDEYFMKEALKEAKQSALEDEVPVGAVVVCDNRIIARAHNLTEKLNDVTAHAEMLAITAAANYLGGKYLDNCSIYITLEPCIMCAGALHHAHIGKVVWGADDSKKGFTIIGKNVLHPKTEVSKGICSHESEQMLKTFFAKKRS
jgi:tRNA(adenine34) deaminase